MATIRREIEVEAAPQTTAASWDHFLLWVRTAQHRLACDELACADAVGAGVVRFEDAPHGRTRVLVQTETDGAPSPAVVGQQIIHDLLVFKDYIERRRGDPRTQASERQHRLREDERRNEPAHLHTSEENHNSPAGGSYADHYPT
jgi:uncharacterized membrane protein